MNKYKLWSYYFIGIFILVFTVSSSPQSDCYSFYTLGRNDKYYPEVEKQFQKIIKPLYGDQSYALRKIQQGKDRTCEILLDSSSHVVGVMVYKNQPNKAEFQKEGKTNVFEVKSFFLTNAAKNSRKGLGSLMMEHLIDYAQSKKCYDYIVITVSENIISTQKFLEKKEFTIFKKVLGKYKKNVKELYYAKALSHSK